MLLNQNRLSRKMKAEKARRNTADNVEYLFNHKS